MSEATTVDQSTWSHWFLDAIRKIRSQKQRPSAERIIHAVRQHHNYHEDVISEHLEVSVKEGVVLKVFNKGQSSYKDPGVMQYRKIKVDEKADLSKVIGRAVRELGERDGSTLKSIEKYLTQSHMLDLTSPDIDIKNILRMSIKRAVAKGFIIQEGKNYKSVEYQSPNVAAVTPKKKSNEKHDKHETTPKKSSPDTADNSKVSHIFYKHFLVKAQSALSLLSGDQTKAAAVATLCR